MISSKKVKIEQEWLERMITVIIVEEIREMIQDLPLNKGSKLIVFFGRFYQANFIWTVLG